jgi:hypothetical protein
VTISQSVLRPFGINNIAIFAAVITNLRLTIIKVIKFLIQGTHKVLHLSIWVKCCPWCDTLGALAGF